MSATPILTVENLSVSFKTETRVVPAVKHVSFELYKGQTHALVGESGSGKSVSALSILQLLPYPPAFHPSGSIKLEKTELVGASENTLRKIRGNRISMIFQEPMTSLNPLHTIGKQIAEVLLIHQGFSQSNALQRAEELLTRVGIQNARSRLNAYPHELSGGQRQRVMIAMALANSPDILIADEPTTALDVTIQEQVLNLLKELQQEFGMAILLITHDLGIVKRYAHSVSVMYQGEVVESGSVDKIFHRPEHPYTDKLIHSEPSGAPCPVSDDAPVVMSAKALRVWFPIKQGVFQRIVSYIKAVDDINFELRQGHTLGIVGESGSGKTTLVQAMLRLIDSEGQINFQQQTINSLSNTDLRPLRRHMQIVFQDPYGSLSPRMSIREIVGEGLRIHFKYTEQQAEQEIVKALKEVGLDESALERYPHEFSGGQRQRIAIARALVLKPQLIIFDEPTSALDRTVQAQVVELLRELQRNYGFTYIFISHDLKVVRALSHHVIVLRNGKVVEEGPAQRLFEHPQEAYTRSLIDAAFAL
ncbi:MAG TPA: ABC transporter ATP-binding protein [Pseudomonadales bacterium]|nr:ABC transporter ATP-binding protein [Pseudomonadales bacterium]